MEIGTNKEKGASALLTVNWERFPSFFLFKWNRKSSSGYLYKKSLSTVNMETVRIEHDSI